MKTSRVAVALLIALTPCTLVAPAVAQTPGAEDPITASARARFKEGVEFYDKGEYDQARASFLQAYALKKHPAVLLNLAWSCLKSGHVLEGKKYFEQFLAESTNITDKQRADANDGLTQSRAKLARIEIKATSGTDVTIDGEHVGTAPLSDAVVVEPGAHTVKFKGPDGASDTQSVSVLGGQKADGAVPAERLLRAAAPVPTAPQRPRRARTPTPRRPDGQPPQTPTRLRSLRSTSLRARAAREHSLDAARQHRSGRRPRGRRSSASGTAIVAGLIFKNSAQNKANDLGTKISDNGGPAANPGAYQRVHVGPQRREHGRDGREHRRRRRHRGTSRARSCTGCLAGKSGTSSALVHVPQVTPMIGHSTGGLFLGGSF